MSYVTFIKKSLIAAAAAISVAGFLTVPTAQAAPMVPLNGPNDGCPPVCPDERTATVTSDVDMYNIEGDDSTIFGIMRKGTVVQITGPCTNDGWCYVYTDKMGNAGWVWGSFLQL